MSTGSEHTPKFQLSVNYYHDPAHCVRRTQHGLCCMVSLVSLVSARLFGLPAWSLLVSYVSLVSSKQLARHTHSAWL